MIYEPDYLHLKGIMPFPSLHYYEMISAPIFIKKRCQFGQITNNRVRDAADRPLPNGESHLV